MRALTPSQQGAVFYEEADSAVLAGAGSGKTFVIVEKTAALIERWHVPPEKILVVTFTEKAAEEVKERINKRLSVGAHGHAPLQGVVVSTIHGFAAEILRSDGAALALSPEFRILNDFLANLEKSRAVREKAIERIASEDPEILEAVGRFGFRRSLGFFLDLISEPDHRRSGVPFPETLKALESHYRSRKTGLNALDFDDLEREFLKLIRERPEAFAGRFSWIIVDEFQDTSPIQWEIISQLRKIGPSRLVIVGDPRQSIYRFRGADPSLFLKVAGEIVAAGGRRLELADNFRSCGEIVAFVNAVSEPLFPGDYPPMKASRTDTAGAVERLMIPDEGTLGEFRTAEARAVADRLKALRARGDLWKSMAVLFKTRKAVADYEKAFKEAGIPYRTSLGEALLERPEILTLLFWMQRKGEGQKENKFLDTALKHSALKDFKEDFPADTLSAYLDQLFEAVAPLFPESVHLNLKAYRALLNDLMSLGVGHLQALVTAVRDLREDGARIQCPNAVDERQDAVTMMTVHGAKGLEWPIVVLGDLKAAPVRPPSLYVASEDGDLLLKDGDAAASGLKDKLVKSEAFQEREAREREEALEESKRLLYVALTRAQDRLILPLPIPKAGKKEGPKAPRWSDWLTP
ncbi:MAG TPA: ATP-dependent helicase [bacterium]|nr:ATP-dependent helicase [bacterium]